MIIDQILSFIAAHCWGTCFTAGHVPRLTLPPWVPPLITTGIYRIVDWRYSVVVLYNTS